jgi:hypothetical protein
MSGGVGGLEQITCLLSLSRLLALVTGFLTFPVIVIAGLVMYFTKTRVELHHEQ